MVLLFCGYHKGGVEVIGYSVGYNHSSEKDDEHHAESFDFLLDCFLAPWGFEHCLSPRCFLSTTLAMVIGWGG